jgi:hypothetical protein
MQQKICVFNRNLLDIKERAETTLNATTEWKKEQNEREIIVNSSFMLFFLKTITV